MPVKLLLAMLILFPFLYIGCSDENTIDSSTNPDVTDPDASLTEEQLLDWIQIETFKYFWDFAEPSSGAARERFHPANPSLDAHVVATGGTGFGLMTMLVGMERNFISREQGTQRIGKILDFFETADRFHGAWPHWINGVDGKVIPFSPLDDGGDLVETAFLCQGLVCVYEYFRDGNEQEKELAQKAHDLWMGVEWDWYTQGQNSLYWHWSPNHGFEMDFRLEGYNEVLVTYVLAASSTAHPITKVVYEQGWARGGEIKFEGEAYGYPLLVRHQGSEVYGGPLFWSHYSYLGLDPNGLSDAYANYELVNKNHARINYEFCQDNPNDHAGYGPGFWGLTASYTRNSDGSIGYAAHAPGNDLGIISPTAALSSMPYTPVESMRALRSFYDHREKLLGPAGFYDAFSSDLSWVAQAYLAIDQGPEIIMIENYRSGLLWDLFMQNEEVRSGLDLLGF